MSCCIFVRYFTSGGSCSHRLWSSGEVRRECPHCAGRAQLLSRFAICSLFFISYDGSRYLRPPISAFLIPPSPSFSCHHQGIGFEVVLWWSSESPSTSQRTSSERIERVAATATKSCCHRYIHMSNRDSWSELWWPLTLHRFCRWKMECAQS